MKRLSVGLLLFVGMLALALASDAPVPCKIRSKPPSVILGPGREGTWKSAIQVRMWRTQREPSGPSISFFRARQPRLSPPAGA
jgi:hypothetical protein